jgi:hypothetical protein
MNQQTEPGFQGHPPVRSILEAARAVLTVTRTEQNWSANEEDPRIGYNVVRERTFVLFTQL